MTKVKIKHEDGRVVIKIGRREFRSEVRYNDPTYAWAVVEKVGVELVGPLDVELTD